MATISFRVSDTELNMYKQYASLNNQSLSETIRKTMIERIENEFHFKVFADYEREKNAGTVKTFSHEDVWKELEL